ncbi:MAG: NUDIX domain-containing protein [Candidatus Sungbacteria bacterium]|nr:NUDIX domain-containing protein [Candidatus Sungbacteria bacterium]
MAKINFHQKAIVSNREGKFLVLKASYKGLRWDLPGGAVEIPEEHETALRREVKEEAGIDIDNIIPLVVETAYNKDEDNYVLFIGYRCKAVNGDVKLNNEHTEFRWVTKDEFMELETTPYLKDFVSKSLRASQ